MERSIKDISVYKLIMFDLDGTLAEYKTGVILPNVQMYFDSIHDSKQHLALVSNQGGVGLRYWMEKQTFGKAENYPTADYIDNHIDTILSQLGHDWNVYISYAYQTKKGVWSPEPFHLKDLAIQEQRWSKAWRKPDAGMLRQALADAGVEPSDALMVGDWDEDKISAARAKVDFMWANEFFNRE